MTELAYLFISNMADRMFLSVVGVVISVYSLYVELQKEKNPNFRAACDFNDKMSCSRVLTSKYARGFGFVGKLLGRDHLLNVRNCNLGILFYLAYLTVAPVLLVMSVMGILTSLYLGFILFYVLQDVCVVCISTYCVNGLLLYLNYSYYCHHSHRH
ncbi:vitamin K epoxide reductase complex subunit 1-like protein 1 isoform X2 [Babylonia areolata]|uniref:vitamin K epoxide reductase complex subunit 1-like protein 1 isoform X2 n=1 Tax=Babylonia areolata TaxID=304850 RepID=UPI003FD54BE8